MYINDSISRIWTPTTTTGKASTNSTASSENETEESAVETSASASTDINVLSRVDMDLLSISNHIPESTETAKTDTEASKLMRAAVNIGRNAVSAYYEYLTKAFEESEDYEYTNKEAEYDLYARESMINNRMNSIVNRKA